MNRRIVAACFICALGLNIESVHAGPCSTQIAQFELAVRQSAGKPDAGPFAPQSIGAQTRPPTNAGLDQTGRETGTGDFAATLARAKRLDARGNRAVAQRHSLPPRICTICNDRLACGR